MEEQKEELSCHRRNRQARTGCNGERRERGKDGDGIIQHAMDATNDEIIRDCQMAAQRQMGRRKKGELQEFVFPRASEEKE